MRHPNSLRHDAGMTLMEVMIVLGVGGVVGALAVTLLFQSQSGLQTQTSYTNRVAAARLAINDIAKSLESAYPHPGEGGILFRGVNGNEGTDTLSLARPIRATDGQLAFEEISYSVEPAADGSDRQILRKRRRSLPGDGALNVAPLGLTMDADLPIQAGLEFQYRATAGSGEWQDAWNGNTLPGEVRVEVRFDDARFENQPVALEHFIRPRTDGPAGTS